MNDIVYILICHFGLEKVLKNELKRLKMEIISVVDGEVRVRGNIFDVPKLNYNLRTCERIMIEVGTFEAKTFDELFEGVKKLPIEKFVPIDGAFVIAKANQDKNSILHSSTAIQSIVKKAMVEKLKEVYKTTNLVESNGRYPFRIKMQKNICSVRLDTTGDSLHKRGYRIKSGLAPIEETLAASLIKLTGFCDKFKENRKYDIADDVLIDAFCGSGTIPIEAALIKANIPPCVDRAFVSETWRHIIPTLEWKKQMDEAKSKVDKEILNSNDVKIYGFDIDEKMIAIAKENAARAGVDKMICFKTLPVKDLAEALSLKSIKSDSTKIILSNPPYGERLEDKEKIVPIYKDIKNSFVKIDGAELNIITSFEDAEKYLGKSTKNRKLYNGMLKTYFYTYIKKE